ISARAIGLDTLIRPCFRSASSSPTIWYFTVSPEVSSSSSTVAPNTTRPPASSEDGSMICAAASLPSSSRMRPSMKPWRSLAASYSAFSDRSPCARASAIAWITPGRSTVFSRCSSVLSFSAPRVVMGMVAIRILRNQNENRRALPLGGGWLHFTGNAAARRSRLIAARFLDLLREQGGVGEAQLVAALAFDEAEQAQPLGKARMPRQAVRQRRVLPA